jgi:hypothetical protein
VTLTALEREKQVMQGLGEAIKEAEAIRRWKPWKQSSGPTSAEGKAKVSRNADTGGEWRTLRETIKALNQALRDQKAWIK